MGEEFNPYIIGEFEWDVLKAYIKHGYGNMPLYSTTFFSCNMTNETALITLQEFYDKVVDYDDFPWSYKN